MAKLILTDLANLANENTAVAAINANNLAIETALENTLSRDGTAPNQMGASLDMNSNRIINLPAPVGDNDAVRYIDVRAGITGPTGPQGPQGDPGAVGIVGTPTVNQIAAWVTASSVKGVSITGLVKGNGASVMTAAVAGTDYLAPPSGTAILKAASGGALANAVSGTDYQLPIGTISGIAKGNGANALTAASAGTDYVSPTVATAFSAQQYYTLATITDAANLVWTVSSGQKAKVTLGGNRTMNAVTGSVEGATYTLWVIQDGTGSRTITWTTTGAGSFDFGTGGAPVLTTTVSKADLLTFEAISIGGTLKLRYSGIVKGFS